MEGFVTSEVPGLEGMQMKEGSALAVMAGAATYWNKECIAARRQSRLRLLVCWLAGAACGAAGFGWWLQ